MTEGKENKPIVSPLQVKDLQEKKGDVYGLKPGTFDAVLRELGGRACIVIGLTQPVMSKPASCQFRISAANIGPGLIPFTLELIAKIMKGELPGTTKGEYETIVPPPTQNDSSNPKGEV
jgi:hypothetical protein